MPVAFHRAANSLRAITALVFTRAGFGGGARASGRGGAVDFSIDVSAAGAASATGAGAGCSGRAIGCAIFAGRIRLPGPAVGNGLETASGSATPNITTPANAAVVIMTTRVVRSADRVARPARITPSPGEFSDRSEEYTSELQSH